ncbi:MAG TPA: hydrogenase maturation nickel metallochaperone HypA [Rubrivivax sp.]|jgi:hydrogenase nickel incorporation protein HypA/HybF|nr:hydrogenase maturation nickel metallochaperone HypA [Pseudomonadota bacterium]HPP83985.1 hydrogenase maturation nickel metallochaperone HypA [Rubrivivax sp.]
MHELSLAAGVVRLVEEAAQRERFARVSRLTLEVGALAGVDVGALRFALEVGVRDTCLAGAAIVIEEPPGRAWCMACATSVAITQRGDACPQCGGYQLQPSGGTELRVVDLIVHDEAPAAAG